MITSNDPFRQSPTSGNIKMKSIKRKKRILIMKKRVCVQYAVMFMYMRAPEKCPLQCGVWHPSSKSRNWTRWLGHVSTRLEQGTVPLKISSDGLRANSRLSALVESMYLATQGLPTGRLS